MSIETGSSISGTLIRGVRIFDGEHVIPNGSVLVRDGVIAVVGPDQPSAEIIDGTGRTLLPGLVDAHTHAFPGSLEQALRFGITTELDLFSIPAMADSLRTDAAARDDVADLRTSSIGATAPGGHPTQLMGKTFGRFPTVTGPLDAKSFVAARVDEGADYIKILIEDGAGMGVPIPSLDLETVSALVDAAHAAGLIAIAHATSLPCASIARKAGVDGFAHAFSAGPDATPGEMESLVAAAVESGTFLISTLALFESLTGSASKPDLAEDHRITSRLSPATRSALGQRLPGFEPPPQAYADALGVTRLFHQAGGTVLAGTDANDGPHGTFPVVHGASMHRELVCLTDAGLEPRAALAAATSAPAERFGLSDRGRIAPGLRADLLLVDGDPTVDITATRSIVSVWRGGARLTNAVDGTKET